jgi:hypothetical protein
MNKVLKYKLNKDIIKIIGKYNLQPIHDEPFLFEIRHSTLAIHYKLSHNNIFILGKIVRRLCEKKPYEKRKNVYYWDIGSVNTMIKN